MFIACANNYQDNVYILLILYQLSILLRVEGFIEFRDVR